MKKILFICMCLAAAISSFAQMPDRKWNIGLHGGLTQYNGDLGQNFYVADQAAYGFGAISISRYLGRHFDATFYGSRGELGNIEPLLPGLPERSGDVGHFRISLNTLSLSLRWNITSPEAVVRPYIFAGASSIIYEQKYTLGESRWDPVLPTGGVGINFHLSDIVSLQLQEQFMYTNDDDIDGEVHDANDSYLLHSLGLTFNLGKKVDTDNDGVGDKNDKCPDTPPGVQVDKNGCPNDLDKDGVADYKDQCVDVAGLAALKGCPDKDSDGIADKDDRCPETAGLESLAGCPDTDSDGVSDLDDKCPGTPTKYKTDITGCPVDNDKDGIINEDDRCPDVYGIASLQGCADTDGDGVSDLDDRCPSAKGTLANKGCPEISKVDIQRITTIASKIYFETNSAKLKMASLASLDDLASILNRYEGANLTVEGHTDNVGEDAYNLELSQKRTESVRDYLISKGISSSRLTAVGYGESRPVADNKTSVGRSRNRRVELKTSY